MYASAAGDPGKVRPKEASLPWFDVHPALPNDTEMLLFALVNLVSHQGRLAELKPWTSEAMAEEKAFSAPDGSWVQPKAWQSRGNVVPPIHQPLNYIFNERTWVSDELEHVGKYPNPQHTQWYAFFSIQCNEWWCAFNAECLVTSLYSMLNAGQCVGR